MSIRDDIARLVWIGGSGFADAWDEVKNRDRRLPSRPNFIDETVDECWSTADLIIEYLGHRSGAAQPQPCDCKIGDCKRLTRGCFEMDAAQ